MSKINNCDFLYFDEDISIYTEFSPPQLEYQNYIQQIHMKVIDEIN